MVTKNDIEIEKIKAFTERFHELCGIIKHLFSIVGVLFAIKIIFLGMLPFLSSSPDVINAMAVLIEKINISNISGYILAGGTSTGWYIERKGKKRAIQKKGEYQKLAEGNDNSRSSSGLTEKGETPGGET